MRITAYKSSNGARLHEIGRNCERRPRTITAKFEWCWCSGWNIIFPVWTKKAKRLGLPVCAAAQPTRGYRLLNNCANVENSANGVRICGEPERMHRLMRDTHPRKTRLFQNSCIPNSMYFFSKTLVQYYSTEHTTKYHNKQERFLRLDGVLIFERVLPFGPNFSTTAPKPLAVL